MNNYEPVIGLEIHVELKTKNKMFCQCCANYFGKDSNTNTCPVCLGMPGALPVPNKKAVEWTILLGKALNCHINTVSKFDRKHYFYPDLAKGYQISQYDEPFCVNGHLSIFDKETKENKKFRIHRIHLEEDTGKLTHAGEDTLIDFNRSSVPLVEIVTEADFHDSQDVKEFLEELYTTIKYLDISDADMEKGSMRMEPNISVRIKGQTDLPKYKVEIKNINSFRYVKQAIDFEVKRHIEILEKGETPVQETRGFNDVKQITYSQRTKENAEDYRYFPEPDIPAMYFTESEIKEIEKNIPELPYQKRERYEKEFGLKYDDAFVLTRNLELKELFEGLLNEKRLQALLSKKEITYQEIANYLINKLDKKMSVHKREEKIAGEIITAHELKKNVSKILISEELINKVLSSNPKVVEDYKSGKTNAIMFLVGQVMKEMKGQADAKTVKEKLEEMLK